MRLLLVPLVAFLVSCAAPEPRVEYRVVKAPEPPVIVVPAKPVISLTAPPNEKARALLDYIIELRAALDSALIALDAYRTKSD
jgi:hypothetical protein